MARNASGVMSLSGQFAVPNQIAVSNTINGYIDDILNEITDSLSRSGKGGMQTDLDMGSHKVINMLAGVAGGDGATIEQIQTNITNHATSVGGTGDAITAGFTPAITSLDTHLALRVTATAANTITNPVINVDGLGNKTIKKNNGAALAAGDIAGAGHIMALVYNGTDFLLLNPAAPSLNNAALTGNPTAPTPAAGDNDTSIPTTAWVTSYFEPLGKYTAINDQVGTTYTFVLTDIGKLVSGNNAAAITFTVPTNAVTAFPIGARIDVYQRGAGQITISGAGVTFRSKGGALKVVGQYSACTLVKLATDEWLVFGDLTT